MTLTASEGRPGFAISGLGLRGVVCALPERCVENETFVERFGAKVVEDVAAMTGVETRYWAAEGQTTGDLCLAAARRLLERLDWSPDSVDALLFVSQTPDQRLPATACVLHGALGLSPHCQALDINLGCSGYVYGLWVAAALMKAGCTRLLLLAGDTSSRLLDLADRSTAMLFGDAGSASAVEHHDGGESSYFVLGTDGKGAANLIVPSGGFRVCPPDPRRAAGVDPDSLFMDGGEVFGFTLRAVPKLVRETLQGAGIDFASVDAFVLHQANRFMLRHIGKKLAIDPARMPINIDRFGNTSSASIPLVLSTDLAERVTGAETSLVIAGFGVGYSWGAAALNLAPLVCAEVLRA